MVVREFLDDGEIVGEADEDLVKQGDEAVVQQASRHGGLKHDLEMFLCVGPQVGILDQLAHPADACAHRLHGSSF